jgi:hypothetical protein
VVFTASSRCQKAAPNDAASHHRRPAAPKQHDHERKSSYTRDFLS